MLQGLNIERKKFKQNGDENAGTAFDGSNK